MDRSKKLILISVISGLVISFAAYLTLPAFQASNIIVLGNPKMTPEEIESRRNILLEENTFLLDKQKIKEAFSSDPYIESVEISSKFPETAIFNIKKRQAVATVKFSGGFLVIDENGAVLESTQELSKIVKPLISGIEVTQVKLGEKLDIENQDIFGLIQSVISNVRSAKLLNNISQIEITGDSEILMTTPQGVNVLLGKGENLNEKMLILNQILIDLHEKKIYSGYIDMRYDGYPVYRRTK